MYKTNLGTWNEELCCFLLLILCVGIVESLAPSDQLFTSMNFVKDDKSSTLNEH